MAEAYNPDVLSCLANLSNDEVFTPPSVVNKMLDLLPQELFESPKTTFLDPAAKSGVFLREITKRLIVGLEKKIPDLQERVDHILHKQVFGIATTELTSLVSRRSLYCSKYPNCKYSVSKFDTVEGNIRYRALRHTFVNGRCKWCGASEAQFDRDESLESHAYEFIHILKPQEIFNMKFDVIIGNPPYQMADGGGMGSAMPIYQLFVEAAKKIHPRHLVMIIPSRWFTGGRGLDDFRRKMLDDRHIKELMDFPVSSECFPGVEIKGGVCYFHIDETYHGECLVKTIRGGIASEMMRSLIENGCDTFIRFNEAIPILRKVRMAGEATIERLVSSQKPFGMRTYETGKKDSFNGAVKLYANKAIGYVKKDAVLQNKEWTSRYKVLITAAYGAGEDFPHQIINKPFISEPGSCCTETYLVIGPFECKIECENVISYIRTKFFRFLVLLRKNTQHASASVYSFVPMQDFSKPWTDEELYKKYKLTKDEIAFVESMIKPME